MAKVPPGVHQRHDHPSCPPPDASGKRPRHRCQGRWAAQIELGRAGGKRIRKTIVAKRYADLIAKREDALRAINLGVLPDNITVREWLEHWRDHILPNDEEVRPTTANRYGSYVKNYLIPHLGNVNLQKLRVEHIEAMRDAMRKRPEAEGGPLSDTTIRQAWKILTSALNEAEARGRVVVNVAKRAKPPKAARNPHKKMTVEESRTLMAHAKDSRELARFAAALILGMRQGEALGLRWSDMHAIDTPEGEVWAFRVSEAVARVGGKLQRVPVKSDHSARVYVLPEAVRLIFAGWEAQAPDGEDYIFHGHSGGPEDARRDWQAWTDALERAGLPHYALHAARGSAASAMTNDLDEPDWLVSRLLGHGSVDVTRRHYISADALRAREALAGLSRLVLPVTE